MENNTTTVNNKKKYIIGGAIAVVLILAIILVAVFVNKDDVPVVDEYLEDDTYYVSANLYVASILKGDNGIVEKAGYLYRVYGFDETMRTYSNYIGREFLNNMTVADVNGNDVEIKSGNKKILVFTEGNKEYYDDFEGYLYLGALAKEVGAYDLYVINTNKDTMGDFVDNFNGHLLNKPTPEVVEYFETYPSDFILFIDENNIIECITGLMDVNEVSYGGAYVFSTYYPSYEYMRLFEEYEKDKAAATKKYFENIKNDGIEVLEFDNISTINGAYNLNFYLVDDGSVLNESFLSVVGKVKFTDELYITSEFKNNEGKTLNIQQGINNNSIILIPEDFKYYSSVTTEDLTTIYLYGESQDYVTNFTFSKNNIKVHIYGDRGWNKNEIELIVNNF